MQAREKSPKPTGKIEQICLKAKDINSINREDQFVQKCFTISRRIIF